MPNNKGEKFLCFLPKVEKSKSGKLVTPQNITSMIVESEKRMKLKTPDELLDVLKERCFIRVKYSKTQIFLQKETRTIYCSSISKSNLNICFLLVKKNV